jgi:predicted nucleotidyltransferase component of viral defense system
VIPGSYIQEWTAATPWPDRRQVEQDLIICRALCDIFNEPLLAERLAFRGGTAINKLLFRQPLRYSEDIDLVQVQPEPIGPTVDAVRRALSWLGPCRRKAAAHSIHLVFAFAPEADPTTTLKLKVEINTREHESLYGLKAYPFAVENPWFAGRASVASFESEELFGTKLRALLQRRRGRDLFDLNEGLKQLPLAPERVIASFDHYLAHEGTQITRANAEERMLAKLTRSLTDDIAAAKSEDLTVRRFVPHPLQAAEIFPFDIQRLRPALEYRFACSEILRANGSRRARLRWPSFASDQTCSPLRASVDARSGSSFFGSSSWRFKFMMNWRCWTSVKSASRNRSIRLRLCSCLRLARSSSNAASAPERVAPACERKSMMLAVPTSFRLTCA